MSRLSAHSLAALARLRGDASPDEPDTRGTGDSTPRRASTNARLLARAPLAGTASPRRSAGNGGLSSRSIASDAQEPSGAQETGRSERHVAFSSRVESRYDSTPPRSAAGLARALAGSRMSTASIGASPRHSTGGDAGAGAGPASSPRHASASSPSRRVSVGSRGRSPITARSPRRARAASPGRELADGMRLNNASLVSEIAKVRSDMSKQIRDLQDTLLRERQTRLAEHDTFASSLRKQMSTTDSPVSSKLATDLVGVQNTVRVVVEDQTNMVRRLNEMQQQLDATHSYFRFSEEIAQARRQDAERLQSAEERFETVVKRLNDMEQAFTAVAAADDTPTLTEHKAMAQEVAVLSQRVHHLVDHFKSFNATFSEQSAKHTKFEEQTVEGEQLRREEHAMEMLQFQEMFNGFKTEVLRRLDTVETEVAAMKTAVETHTSLVESLQSSHASMKQKSQQLVEVVHQLRVRFLDDLKTKQSVKRHAAILVMLQDEVRDMKQRHLAALRVMHQRQHNDAVSAAAASQHAQHMAFATQHSKINGSFADGGSMRMHDMARSNVARSGFATTRRGVDASVVGGGGGTVRAASLGASYMDHTLDDAGAADVDHASAAQSHGAVHGSVMGHHSVRQGATSASMHMSRHRVSRSAVESAANSSYLFDPALSPGRSTVVG